MIGEVQANGQFTIVYQSKALPPKPWSPYVEANKGKVADWSWPWVCGGCTRRNTRPSKSRATAPVTARPPSPGLSVSVGRQRLSDRMA